MPIEQNDIVNGRRRLTVTLDDEILVFRTAAGELLFSLDVSQKKLILPTSSTLVDENGAPVAGGGGADLTEHTAIGPDAEVDVRMPYNAAYSEIDPPAPGDEASLDGPMTLSIAERITTVPAVDYPHSDGLAVLIFVDPAVGHEYFSLYAVDAQIVSTPANDKPLGSLGAGNFGTIHASDADPSPGLSGLSGWVDNYSTKDVNYVTGLSASIYNENAAECLGTVCGLDVYVWWGAGPVLSMRGVEIKLEHDDWDQVNYATGLLIREMADPDMLTRDRYNSRLALHVEGANSYVRMDGTLKVVGMLYVPVFTGPARNQDGEFRPGWDGTVGDPGRALFFKGRFWDGTEHWWTLATLKNGADSGPDGTPYFEAQVKLVLEAVTAGVGAPNVLTWSESGKAFTNEGASAMTQQTLPAAKAGVQYTFAVQDDDGITIVAQSGQTIRRGASVTSAGGSISSTTIGSVITLLALNDTEWFATSIVGTWA